MSQPDRLHRLKLAPAVAYAVPPNLGALVREVRAADAYQNDAYDSGVEGFMDAADEKKFAAEKALRDALIAQGVEPLDARSMVWGLS